MANDNMYRAAFERLWESASTQAVSNTQPGHASAVFAVFLTKATKRAVFFCKELHPEVYDDALVIEALDGAIDRGVSVQVIVQEKANASSLFASRMRQAQACPESKVRFEDQAPPQVRDFNFNFAFVDDRGYRIEPERDPSKALAAANSPEVVTELGKLFDAVNQCFRNASTLLGNPH
ncbi:MAG TPA: hypothetical protein VFT72_01175 [Opitutaceae bacterium]|nr:hypothetical protein [Opitutaceae bacterium]